MRTWAVDIPFSCSCCPQPRCAHTTYWNLTLSSRKQRRIEHIWKPCKSPKLAPVVTKKRSGQSVKPNDKHNIYKFQFCSLTLKKMYSLFLCVVGFFFSFFCFFFLGGFFFCCCCCSFVLAACSSPAWGMAVWLQSVVILSRRDITRKEGDKRGRGRGILLTLRSRFMLCE